MIQNSFYSSDRVDGTGVQGDSADDHEGDNPPGSHMKTESSPIAVIKYAGRSYEVDLLTVKREKRDILLPDGTRLRVHGWYKSWPISPSKMQRVWWISFRPTQAVTLRNILKISATPSECSHWPKDSRSMGKFQKLRCMPDLRTDRC
jgi:hypothetical protein